MRIDLSTIVQNFPELEKLTETIKDGSFESGDDVVVTFENTIKSLYSNVMERKRNLNIQDASSLDMVDDGFGSIFDTILEKYDRSNKTSSGFDYIDEHIMMGGYEPSRLYVWAGGSGSGKSTLLTNSIVNTAFRDNITNLDYMGRTNEPLIYIYITCENSTDESLVRMYAPMFNMTQVEVLRKINTDRVDLEQLMKNKIDESKCIPIIKYFPQKSISPLDIMNIVNDITEKYPGVKIAGLYIDYLDLLKSDRAFEIYRFELDNITSALKNLAVEFNIPVITATQLNKQAYTIKSCKELNLDQMSESIKKVEHADFVGLLARSKSDQNIVFCKIGKNRSGISDVNLQFDVDFSQFKFNSCSEIVEEDTRFSGLGDKL